MHNIWETTENWENEAISSGLVTQRLYFLKKKRTLNGHFSRPAETDSYVAKTPSPLCWDSIISLLAAGNCRLRSKEAVVPILFPSFSTFDKSMQFEENSTRPITLTWLKARWSKNQRCKNQRREPLGSVSIKTLDRVVGDQGKAQRFKGTEEHCRQDSQTASADFFSFCTKNVHFHSLWNLEYERFLTSPFIFHWNQGG